MAENPYTLFDEKLTGITLPDKMARVGRAAEKLAARQMYAALKQPMNLKPEQPSRQDYKPLSERYSEV